LSRTEELELPLEIPTLAPAAQVLAAIHRLQAELEIADLVTVYRSRKGAYQAVNLRYNEPIAWRCHALFADLVPTRHDRIDLYTTLFRSVYATIATHWFCPEHVSAHDYMAEIQGHFTLAPDGRKLPNLIARQNYND
jgi:Telomere resolvase